MAVELEHGSQLGDKQWSKCGVDSLTSRDFWKHCDNEDVAAMMRSAFNSVTIENFGLHNNQTSGTVAFTALLARWLQATFAVFGLNGRRGLDESKAPESVRRGFFCSEEKFQELLVRILPEEMEGLWAAPDREGPPFLRYDNLSLFHGLSLLAVPDLKFYYMGCSFEGMDGCQWASSPEAYWPPHLGPNVTLAELLALPMLEIALHDYNVDLRELVGITGLGAFTSVTLTIRQVIVAPFPSDQVVQTPWLCALWFMLQQYIIGTLNASVCPMNYRFTVSFLLGAGAWSLLRNISNMYHCLNIPSGGTVPIDQPTLFAATARLMNYICSIYRENNRGGFRFRTCDVTTSVQVPEPRDCAKECSPLCSDIGRGVNDSTASNNGDALCQCPKCCDRECPTPCPPQPCPPPSCEVCPTTAAPQCLPKLGDLVSAFVDYVFVSSSSSQSSSLLSLSSSSSGAEEDPSVASAFSHRAQGNLKKVKGRDGVVSTFGSSGSGGSYGWMGGRVSYQMLKEWQTNLETIFAQIALITGSSRSSRLLAQLYLKLFSAIQPTNLAHDFFTINPSAWVEALTVQAEIIFRYTLGRGTNQLIRLNHSPLKIPRTAFTALLSVLEPSQLRGIFISCTNDTQGGALRPDWLTMVDSILRTSISDFWAYYRSKRLEGFTPCQWSRLSSCYWSLDPNMTLAAALAHPLMGIYLRVYVLDNRAFTGIPGLQAFENVTLTLREVLGSDNPIQGEPWLDFVWSFIIQQGIAGYLNSTLSCIFYRFGGGGYIGYPFFILRMISDMVYALNTQQQPQPPIDSPLLVSSTQRLLTFTDTVAHENGRGVKHWKRFKLDTASLCTRRTGCTCKTSCVDSPDVAALAKDFVVYMTLVV